MNIPYIIKIVEIVLAVLLMIIILIQQKGSNLGAAFGGDTEFYRTKRGPEKILHIITVVLGALFLAIAAINLFV